MNPARFRRLSLALERRQPDLTVLMERVHKSHNLSAILRNCDAVGVLEVHAVLPPEGLDIHAHTSAGTAKWVRGAASRLDRRRRPFIERRWFPYPGGAPRGRRCRLPEGGLYEAHRIDGGGRAPWIERQRPRAGRFTRLDPDGRDGSVVQRVRSHCATPSSKLFGNATPPVCTRLPDSSPKSSTGSSSSGLILRLRVTCGPREPPIRGSLRTETSESCSRRVIGKGGGPRCGATAISHAGYWPFPGTGTSLPNWYRSDSSSPGYRNSNPVSSATAG